MSLEGFSKRVSARVLIIDSGKILLIKRFKHGRLYYVIPGGGVEKGESPKDAAIREAKEETNLDVEIGNILFRNEDELSIGLFFLASSFSGVPKFIGPELRRASEQNSYDLEWKKLNMLSELDVIPSMVKELLQSL